MCVFEALLSLETIDNSHKWPTLLVSVGRAYTGIAMLIKGVFAKLEC